MTSLGYSSQHVMFFLATLGVGSSESRRMAFRRSSWLNLESYVGVTQKRKLPFSKAPAKTQIVGSNISCLL
jgi:hypothetical protein